mmetsp:Transcript_1838/g.2414  ORF Transcript_1838/g.2414 Transcript_1838/m.2414 type:complete len:495 (-) Transcript_1838:206-1690(-)
MKDFYSIVMLMMMVKKMKIWMKKLNQKMACFHQHCYLIYDQIYDVNDDGDHDVHDDDHDVNLHDHDDDHDHGDRGVNYHGDHGESHVYHGAYRDGEGGSSHGVLLWLSAHLLYDRDHDGGAPLLDCDAHDGDRGDVDVVHYYQENSKYSHFHHHHHHHHHKKDKEEKPALAPTPEAEAQPEPEAEPEAAMSKVTIGGEEGPSTPSSGGAAMRKSALSPSEPSDSSESWFDGATENKNLPPGWVEFAADDGTPYYFNEETNETTWDVPGAGAMDLDALAESAPPDSAHLSDSDDEDHKDGVISLSNSLPDLDVLKTSKRMSSTMAHFMSSAAATVGVDLKNNDEGSSDDSSGSSSSSSSSSSRSISGIESSSSSQSVSSKSQQNHNNISQQNTQPSSMGEGAASGMALLQSMLPGVKLTYGEGQQPPAQQQSSNSFTLPTPPPSSLSQQHYQQSQQSDSFSNNNGSIWGSNGNGGNSNNSSHNNVKNNGNSQSIW